MDESWVKKIRQGYPQADIEQSTEPKIALAEADFVYTRRMDQHGQENEAAKRKSIFAPYQLNAALMRHAPNKARVLHCLPARRGEK